MQYSATSDSPPDLSESRALLNFSTRSAAAIAVSRMADIIADFDWSRTPLGPTQHWPQSLKTAVRLLLGSRYPMFVWWGKELIALYNDAYIDVLGPRHPWALGRSARETWSELWDVLGLQADEVMQRGAATWNDSVLLVMERKGFTEETYFTFSYSPCFDDQGRVGGVFCACEEETARVLGERRLQSLRALSEAMLDARTAARACETAAAALAGNPHDVPFALLYLQDAPGEARLAAHAGVPAGSPLAVPVVQMGTGQGPWPLEAAEASRSEQLVEGLAQLHAIPAGPWPEPVQRALVFPLQVLKGTAAAGFVVIGLNTRRPLDADYRDYLSLVVQQISSALAHAQVFEEEQRRADALAELDRAKTTFFSNISHELRTPLALMLGPIGELAEDPELAPARREALQLAHRNGHRLQRLVNTLLDFSRIEAGRMHACFRPLDLASYTRELASFFHSAAMKAGLELRIACEPLPQPVFVDRLLWEKIVFNLLANAIKYTPSGAITVRLAAEGGRARLQVQDTGIGIPPDALPRVFERFFRVEGAAGRSIEGSGIGLALVAELARMHGAEVEVQSEPGRGSTFSILLPFGSAHLPPEQVEAAEDAAAPSADRGWLDEIQLWTGEYAAPAGLPASFAGEPASTEAGDSGARLARGGRVLLVDDNADMRQYLAGLLGQEHDVRTAADGVQALERIGEQVPDLVLTDVMMPRMDGFGLLRALRSQEATAGLPVIVLSAHAGEEARLQALEAGADDFLVKPFHARELLARVTGMLRLRQVRQEAMARERALRGEIQNVLESITEGFVAVDEGWHFTYVNAAAEQMYDMPRDALLGRSFWDVFPDVVGTAFEAPFRRAMADRRPVTVDAPYDPLGGWYEVNVYPMASGGLSFYFRDVLQNRLLEKSLRESEQRFREMAESMPQIVYVCDAGGQVEYLNQQWSAYTGRDHARPEDLAIALHPLDLGPFLHQCGKAAQERLPVSAEVRVRSALDGSYRWFLARAVPVLDDRGQVLRWYGTATDIDASTRSAEALAQANAALQLAERRKDDFIATLAHELRNPLAPLRNGVQLLSVDSRNFDPGRIVGMMRRQVDQLARLVDDLLEVSRITSGKITLQTRELTLANVLADAAETSRPLIEAGRHRLVMEVGAAETMWVQGDPVRLGQVFANLLNNAAKYTEPGGRIHLHAARDADEAVVTVSDSGIGMPQELLQEVFEPFVQVERSTARAQGGLGIGLSIVKRLVELHGGSVSAASAGVGRGSVFTVRLPLKPAQAPAKPQDDGPTLSRTGAGAPTVLVVDDNRDAADSLAAMLEVMGARVQVAYAGAEALEVAHSKNPSLVLLDLGMPEMDGYEVARRLAGSARRGEMKLVALTGWGQAADRARTSAAGFDGHLVKPVDLESLQQMLSALPASR